jgi:hypothetical protein
MNEIQLNQQVAEQICDARQSNGRQFHAGEWVALLDGQVVAVARDLDAALRSLRALDPDPGRGMVFEVATPVTDVIRWGRAWQSCISRASTRAIWLKSSF